MKSVIAGFAACAFFLVALSIVIYTQRAHIQVLNAQNNASAQALALCNTKQLSLESAITSQNDKIEQLKIYTKKAADDLILARGKMIEKWQVTDNMTTCEEKLQQIDALQKTFYKERN
jgi:hypothetical protein